MIVGGLFILPESDSLEVEIIKSVVGSGYQADFILPLTENYRDNEVIIEFTTAYELSFVNQGLSDLGFSLKNQFVDNFALYSSNEPVDLSILIPKIAKIQGIKFIQPNYQYQFLGDLPSNYKKYQNGYHSNFEVGILTEPLKDRVVIAVISDGIDYYRQIIQPNLWYPDKVCQVGYKKFPIKECLSGGWDFANNRADPFHRIVDKQYGSAIAEKILTLFKTPDSAHNHEWPVKIMSLRTDFSSVNLYQSIKFAKLNGAQILYFPLGLETHDPLIERALKSYLKEGVVVINAIETVSGQVSFPANIKHEQLISVLITTHDQKEISDQLDIKIGQLTDFVEKTNFATSELVAVIAIMESKFQMADFEEKNYKELIKEGLDQKKNNIVEFLSSISKPQIQILQAKVFSGSQILANNTWTNQTQIDFSWEPPSFEGQITGYNYALNADPWPIDFSDQPRFSVSGLLDGQYNFSVIALNSQNKVGPAKNLKFNIDTISPVIRLVQPKNDECVNNLEILLHWAPEADESVTWASLIKEYSWQIARDQQFQDLVLAGTSQQLSALITLEEDGPYYWRVRAYDEAENIGDWTEPSIFNVDITAPVLNSGLEISYQNWPHIVVKGSITESGLKEPVHFTVIESLELTDYSKLDTNLEISPQELSGVVAVNDRNEFEIWLDSADFSSSLLKINIQVIDKASNKSEIKSFWIDLSEPVKEDIVKYPNEIEEFSNLVFGDNLRWINLDLDGV